MLNEHEKSDDAIVPQKSSNNAARAVAEEMEERASAKGNVGEQNVPRTQSRTGTSIALARVHEAARGIESYGSPRFYTTFTMWTTFVAPTSLLNGTRHQAWIERLGSLTARTSREISDIYQSD